MLLDFKALAVKYQLRISGVVHVGAHLAEEAPIYAEMGIKRVVWVEGNPLVEPKLRPIVEQYAGQELVIALVSDTDGELVTFHVTNNDGMSSSILEFGTHRQLYPDTVFEHHIELPTHSLDGLDDWWDFEDCNMLSMDIQGAELKALSGGARLLRQMEVVMLEVNQAELYQGCAQIDQLDILLGAYDMRRVETAWVDEQGWGDALWLRN